MYTQNKSAKLTLFVTYTFMALLVVLMVFGSYILEWYYGSVMKESTVKIVMGTFYACCPSAWTALICIVSVMKNVIKEEVFTEGTVKNLRIISWCCAFVTAVCMVSGFLYPVFFIFGLGAAFMTVIMRVLKNVMAAATNIKKENELTI